MKNCKTPGKWRRDTSKDFYSAKNLRNLHIHRIFACSRGNASWYFIIKKVIGTTFRNCIISHAIWAIFLEGLYRIHQHFLDSFRHCSSFDVTFNWIDSHFNLNLGFDTEANIASLISWHISKLRNFRNLFEKPFEMVQKWLTILKGLIIKAINFF